LKMNDILAALNKVMWSGFKPAVTSLSLLSLPRLENAWDLA